jgi:DNA polymerase elongation subunit (family B)
MYKKVFAQQQGKNKYKIHLWDEGGYDQLLWTNKVYEECSPSEAKYKGLNGENLKKVSNWYKENPNIHFHDMPPHQKFLIEKYGIDDTPSTGHKEFFFDIETKMLDSLTPESIKEANKEVTSIAWYYKQEDKWGLLILDPNGKVSHTKYKNKEIIPCKNEKELLLKFLECFREIDPDIIIGWNSDYFDIPYLYYRMCRVLGEEMAGHLSPIGYVRETPWFTDQFIQIIGVESLDFIRLHKKFSWADEPSLKLDVIGKKHVGLEKIEFEGNLDDLFINDPNKYIAYNFRDVEILVLLDPKWGYLSLVKNLSHKGKHNYSEVYANTKTQDGAISAYLLSQGIIPPARERHQESKKNYAGGYLFCPKAGIYNWMFDEDLTSLYPSIIMTINIGKETLIGRIIDEDDRNNRLGLNDLKMKDPSEILTIENAREQRTEIKVIDLINTIINNNMSISANGVIFTKERESVLSIILKKWFKERTKYKEEMKEAYNSGNKDLGDDLHMKQYTMKILLNSLYGATAQPSFRYGSNLAILSEAITLSGHRIICESALFVNKEINKIMRDPKLGEEYRKSLQLK